MFEDDIIWLKLSSVRFSRKALVVDFLAVLVSSDSLRRIRVRCSSDVLATAPAPDRLCSVVRGAVRHRVAPSKLSGA